MTTEPSPPADVKDVLVTYLRRQHDAVLWKVAGISERELRTPMTTSGTNLLGVVKHVALVESEYFGVCVGRPFPDPLPWDPDEPNADMWARADESAQRVVDFYLAVIAHSEQVLAELPLDAPATVPWWSPPETTVGRLLVHMTAETARHAGHLDIVREQLDGARGMLPDVPNLPDLPDLAGVQGTNETWWADYVARLQAIAEAADDTGPAVRSLPA